MTLRDLFPQGSTVAAHAVRSPVPVGDVLEALESDALTVAVIANDLSKGSALTAETREKLLACAGRICAAIEHGKERRYDSRYRG
jgi:hypothetical protein